MLNLANVGTIVYHIPVVVVVTTIVENRRRALLVDMILACGVFSRRNEGTTDYLARRALVVAKLEEKRR